MNQTNQRTDTATVTAWMVGIIALIALIIAWAAFNRSGEDLVPTVRDDVQGAASQVDRAAVAVDEAVDESTREVSVAFARAEARAELLTVAARLEREEATAEVAAEVAEIEQDLARAYRTASADVQQDYTVVQAEFQELERTLREGTGDALETLAGLTLLLEEEVRTDAESAPNETP